MKRCAICNEPARFKLEKRATGVPLTVFGRTIEPPAYLCDEHGTGLSDAGAVVTRVEPPVDEGPAPMSVALLCAILAVLTVGCADFGRVVDDVLPDRLGIGRQSGYLEGAEIPGFEVKEKDRDLETWNLYVEWDLPQISYEPPRRDKEDARMDREILRAILNELRAMGRPATARSSRSEEPPRDGR